MIGGMFQHNYNIAEVSHDNLRKPEKLHHWKEIMLSKEILKIIIEMEIKVMGFGVVI